MQVRSVTLTVTLLLLWQAERTDDEKVMLPVHMRCDACQATSYQGALSLQHALEVRYSYCYSGGYSYCDRYF